MESENGVTLEDESVVIKKDIVEEMVPNPSKDEEKKNVDDIEVVAELNGVPELATKTEGTDSSEVPFEVRKPVSVSKNSTPAKDPSTIKRGLSKKDKVSKEKSGLKGTTPFPQNQRRILSQSLSFPARGAQPNVMKSMDGYPMKTNIKQARANGKKSEFPLSNGSVKSASRLNANRGSSTAVKPKQANRTGNGTSLQQTSVESVPMTQHPTPEISVSTEATPNGSPSSGSIFLDQNLEPQKSALALKADDDAQSTNSTRGRRSSMIGFSFRLEERAEKRKEKIQAKEAEKNSLQEKSKESQEAEIRKLRKSMAFKATPMPSFYKEPPPKVELKKIPTTRPKSPKLGRHKCSLVGTNNTADGSPRSCCSPRVNMDTNNSIKGLHAKSEKDVASSKKPTRKSQPRLQSQETAASRNEGKAIKPKPKASEAQSQNKVCTKEAKESENQSASHPTSENLVDQTSDASPAPMDGVIPMSSTMVPNEVTVEG